MRDETGSQTNARLLEVIARADFEVLPIQVQPSCFW